MAINYPDKSKGLTYTNEETPGVDLDNVYDCMMNFDTKVLSLVFASVSSDETARSIITYIQVPEPTDPDWGDIWVDPSVPSAKIFRMTNTWADWGLAGLAGSAFQEDVNGDLMPTLDEYDLIWEDDGVSQLQDSTTVTDTLTFESDATNIQPKE